MDSELAYTGPVVVFDLDDTLYKELDFVKSGFRVVADLVAAKTGIAAKTLYADMIAERDMGGNAFDMLASRHFSHDKAGFVQKAVETYRFHQPQISLRPGAETLLETLADKGVRLGIVSDGRSATQRNKIKALGIARHFAPGNILISEETGVDKTSTLPWQTIVRRYPNASRFIYAGDNPAKDFLTPGRLGWLTVGLRDTDGENIHPQVPTPSPAHDPQVWIAELSEIQYHLR